MIGPVPPNPGAQPGRTRATVRNHLVAGIEDAGGVRFSLEATFGPQRIKIAP